MQIRGHTRLIISRLLESLALIGSLHWALQIRCDQPTAMKLGGQLKLLPQPPQDALASPQTNQRFDSANANNVASLQNTRAFSSWKARWRPEGDKLAGATFDVRPSRDDDERRRRRRRRQSGVAGESGTDEDQEVIKLEASRGDKESADIGGKITASAQRQARQPPLQLAHFSGLAEREAGGETADFATSYARTHPNRSSRPGAPLVRASATQLGHRHKRGLRSRPKFSRKILRKITPTKVLIGAHLASYGYKQYRNWTSVANGTQAASNGTIQLFALTNDTGTPALVDVATPTAAAINLRRPGPQTPASADEKAANEASSDLTTGNSTGTADMEAADAT